MSDIERLVLFANLAFMAGILVVFVLRKPVRLKFGARLGYALWLLPPLAALATLVPARVVSITVKAPEQFTAPLPEPIFSAPSIVTPAASVPEQVVYSPPTLDIAMLLALLWIAGVVVMVAWLARRQSLFMADLRLGKAGPAVVGFLKPRIVTPSDFEARFEDHERRVILMHETIHLDRNDARINALVAFLRCALWYNPLVHIAAHCLRIDQELSCDAAVVERQPKLRKLYADALVKAQLVARPLPLGCYWPAGTEHPLMERIAMLKQAAPGRIRRIAGAALLTSLALGAGLAAWAAKPVNTTYVIEEPTPEPQQAQPMTAAAVPSRNPIDIGPVKGFGDAFDVLFNPTLLEWPAIKGTLTGIDRAGPNIIFTIKAKTVQENFKKAAPNTDTWRVMLVDGARWALAPFGDGKAIGKDIFVLAAPPKDTSCGKTCIYGVVSLSVDNGGASEIANYRFVGFDTTKILAVSRPNDAPDATPAAGFDEKSYVAVRGRIVRINGAVPVTSFWVQASEINRNYGKAEASTTIWRVDAAALASKNPAFAATGDYRVGMDVRVDGYVSRSCQPECSIQPMLIDLPRQAATDAPAPATPVGAQPVRFEPQQAPAAAAVRTDVAVTLRGKITRVDMRNPNSTIWVQGETINPQKSGRLLPEPTSKLYRVNVGSREDAPGWAGLPDAIGATVFVTAYETGDGSCKLECELAGKSVELAGFPNRPAPCAPIAWKAPGIWESCRPIVSLAVPGLTSGSRLRVNGSVGGIQQMNLTMPPPDPGPDFLARYNTEREATLRGAITSTEVAGTNLVLTVKALSLSPQSGAAAEPETRTWRVLAGRAYLPGNTVETLRPSIVGQDVSIRGYTLKNDACAPACLMTGRDVTVTQKPSGGAGAPPAPIPAPPTAPAPQPIVLDQQAPPRAPNPPGVPPDWVPFAKYFDAEKPVMLKGKVVGKDLFEGKARMLWIESAATRSGSAKEFTPDTHRWRVVLGAASKTPELIIDRFIGQEVTVRGYLAKDANCDAGCLMNGRDITLASGEKLPTATPTASPAPSTPDRVYRAVFDPDQQAAPAQSSAKAPSVIPADGLLRVVAVKRALLEVSGNSGTKYVRRTFDAGESYSLRVGQGWTVSAEDGAAFEWRLGDRSQPLGPAGADVQAQSVDAAATALKAPNPTKP